MSTAYDCEGGEESVVRAAGACVEESVVRAAGACVEEAGAGGEGTSTRRGEGDARAAGMQGQAWTVAHSWGAQCLFRAVEKMVTVASKRSLQEAHRRKHMAWVYCWLLAMPHFVPHFVGALQIDTGLDDHVCVVRDDQRLMCWGQNDAAQSGKPPAGDLLQPYLVNIGDKESGGPILAKHVALGTNHTCVITAEDVLKCWGAGGHKLGYEQCAQNEEDPSLIPVVNMGGVYADGFTPSRSTLTQVFDDRYNGYGPKGGSTGFFSFRVAEWNLPVGTNVAIQSFASNNKGDLLYGYYEIYYKDGTSSGSLQTMNGIGKQAGYIEFTIEERTKEVRIRGGGSYSEFFIYAKDSNPNRYPFVKIDGNSIWQYDVQASIVGTVKQIALGAQHTCAIGTDDAVKCWGKGDNGRLGYGNSDQTCVPPITAVVANAGQVCAGEAYTCVVLLTGNVQCWGQNNKGQLGYGPVPDQTTPVNVNLGTGRTAKHISCGDAFVCVILDDGSMKCWGDNTYGQFGTGSKVNAHSPATTAVTFGNGRTAVQVACGDRHACVLLDDGNVRCWGSNENGQLGMTGSGSIIALTTPNINFGMKRKARQIAAGKSITCVVLDNDQLTCFGARNNGRLGDGRRGGFDQIPCDNTVNLENGRGVLKFLVPCTTGKDGNQCQNGGNATGEFEAHGTVHTCGCACPKGWSGPNCKEATKWWTCASRQRYPGQFGNHACPGNARKDHELPTFSNSLTTTLKSFTVTEEITFTKITKVDVLLVGGGGSGGGDAGGGGGGGEVVEKTVTVQPGTYAIVVGTGGIADGVRRGRKGQDSSAFGVIASGGGGGGGQNNVNGRDGGSSGGCAKQGTPGNPTSTEGMGNIGGYCFSDAETGENGGGGGGAGGVGMNASFPRTPDLAMPSGVSNRYLSLGFNSDSVLSSSDSTSGLSESGTLTLQVTGGIGGAGYAENFHASQNNYIQFETGSFQPTLDGKSRTYIAWYKGSDQTQKEDLGDAESCAVPVFGDPTLFSTMGLGLQDGKIAVCNKGKGARGVTDLTDGEWHMLAWVFDSGNTCGGVTATRMYAGDLAGNFGLEKEHCTTYDCQCTTCLTNTYCTLDRIGVGHPSQQSPSALDGIQIYEVALTEAQLEEIYDTGLNTFAAAMGGVGIVPTTIFSNELFCGKKFGAGGAGGSDTFGGHGAKGTDGLGNGGGGGQSGDYDGGDGGDGYVFLRWSQT